MNKDEIHKRFMEELEHSSAETKRSRGFWAKKFLDFAGDSPHSWNKGLVIAFISQLGKEGYAPLTIRTAYGVVKRVFDAARAIYEQERTTLLSEVNPHDPSAVAEILKAISLPGPQWDIGKRPPIPRIGASDITKPTLTINEIERMVTTAKSGSLQPPEVCYSSLSSVYGLRREELIRVRREHIDFDEKTIFIYTCKGGEQRKQLLCDGIIPYLKEYDFRWEYSPFMMSSMFKKICAQSGVENRDGGGWHQFRRFLDTAIMDLYGEIETKIFLRWKLSGSTAMELRYYTKDPLEIDAKVLSEHPVVQLWK